MSNQPEYSAGNSGRRAYQNGIHPTQPAFALQMKDAREEGVGFLPKMLPQPNDKIDLKMLVLCPAVDDPNAIAICSILSHIAIPFDLLVADRERLTEARLWHGNHAHYQGVIMTTGRLGYWNSKNESWVYALDEEQRELLSWYQARFGIRQVTLFGLPTDPPQENGLQITRAVDTYGAALELSLTEEGHKIFGYLDQDATIPIFSVAAFVAHPIDSSTQPLLKTPTGETMAALYCHPDGREHLTLTFAHSKDRLHTMLLGYGLIKWVTRGLFLGRRRVHLAIHVDDIFNGSRLWDAKTLSGDTGERFCLDGGDIRALLRWLELFNAKRNSADITLDLAFNGASMDEEISDDSQTLALLRQQYRFRWINHGFTHLALDSASQEESLVEIERNDELALRLGLSRYSPDSMVTASLSGLKNPDFLAAASDLGIRLLISDTSQHDGNNPSPNVGITSSLQPKILIIPRHPNNLFFNVSTPDEWVSQFNHTYPGLWQHDLTYAEIIDFEARAQLLYMLEFDMDPLMFHQANLRAYDGTHSLLTDLIDKVLELYSRYCGELPVINLGMYEIGQLMAMRATSNQAAIQATLTVGGGVEIKADRQLTLPITGAVVPGSTEPYAGESISMLLLRCNVPFHIPTSHLVGYQPYLQMSARTSR